MCASYIVNDQNTRLVENIKAVGWNGLEAAFDVLEKRWPGLVRPDKEPIQVLVLGTGMVGKHAVDAVTTGATRGTAPTSRASRAMLTSTP